MIVNITAQTIGMSRTLTMHSAISFTKKNYKKNKHYKLKNTKKLEKQKYKKINNIYCFFLIYFLRADEVFNKS
jgi:hypothetical protein